MGNTILLTNEEFYKLKVQEIYNIRLFYNIKIVQSMSKKEIDKRSKLLNIKTSISDKLIKK